MYRINRNNIFITYCKKVFIFIGINLGKNQPLFKKGKFLSNTLEICKNCNNKTLKFTKKNNNLEIKY